MKPQAMHLNFAPGASTQPPGARAWLVCSVIALLVAAGNLSLELLHNARIAQAQEQLQTTESSLRHAAADRGRSSGPNQIDRAQLQFAFQTARRINAPWGNLLAALENTPANVALLVVEPSAATRAVVLTAETATVSDMLDYLRLLQDDHRLHDVHLVSHTVQTQVPGTPLRFQLEGTWGDAP